jgi:DNA-binding transcriptional ArsR family regulator
MSNMLYNNNIIQILREFSGDYNKRIYGRQISRKLKMNQKTVSNILAKLEKEDIIKFSQEGKNKYYFLNKFNLHLKEVLKLIEIQNKIEFVEKNSKLKDLFDKLEQRTKGMLIIFGSYANYSNSKNSDLDIFIIGKISDKSDLEELYGIKINIIVSEEGKFNKQENIIQEVIKNHVVLKGVEQFIDLIWKS